MRDKTKPIAQVHDRVLAAALAALTITFTAGIGGVAAADRLPTCIGDCDGSTDVTVDEILTLVDIALGDAEPSACPSGLPPGDGVDISLITVATVSAIGGQCAGIAIPELPFAIGACLFPTARDCANPQTQHVLLGNSPNRTDAAAWFAGGGPVDDASVSQFLETFCSANGHSGGGHLVPRPATAIPIQESLLPISTSILADCVLHQGVNVYLVSVIQCGLDPTMPQHLDGFATMKILNIDITTNPSVPTMDVQLVCSP